MKRRSFEESDLIRLRLQRLDRVTSSRPLIEVLFSAAPVLPLAISLIAGIWIRDIIPAGYSMFVFWSGVLVSCGLFLLSLKAGSSRRLYLTLAAACAIFFAAGLGLYHCTIHIGPNHISRCLQSERQLATLKGLVVSPVSSAESNSSIPWLEPQSAFYLDAQSILSEGQWIPVSGLVRVQVAEPVSGIRPGNQVAIYCWLSRFQPPPNPGQFDIRKYMSRKGVYVAASVPIREGVEVVNPSVSLMHCVRSFFYRFCEDSLLDDCLPDRDVRSLSAALLLGRRENLDPAIMAAFQKTNLAHYISLSGQNVGILAGSLWILLRTFGLPKRLRALLCIVLILIYALVVPSMPAINRAVFLACFIFGSFLLRRRSSPVNTLAISALVLLMFRPNELFSMGWQLSYLSVLGILILYEPVVFYLREWIFYPIVLPLETRSTFVQHFLYALLNATAVGVAAWVAIAGLLLCYFGSINPMSPIWTVLVMPFMLVLLYAGYLKLVISKLLPSAAAILSVIIHYAARGFEQSVLFLAKIDICQVICRPPHAVLVVLIYAAILMLLFLPFLYRKTRWSLCLFCGVLFLQPFLLQHMRALSGQTLEMTCLSVGHGQAIVLSGPDKTNVLLDAGSITVRDVGQKIVVPFLQRSGVSVLDAVYVSHGDLDHINALANVATCIRIERLLANTAFLKSADKASLEQDLCRDLNKFDIAPKTITHFSADDMKVLSLWPTAIATSRTDLSENDTSEVLLIEYAGRRLLLCGDIELYAQQELLACYPDLRADVMVLPHHGSTVNLDDRFISHFKPEVIIASCAYNRVENAWQSPEGSTAKVYYTGRDGAVTVKIKADGTLSADGFLDSKQ